MNMKPFQLTRAIQEEYRRYVRTTFPFLDQKISDAFDAKIRSGGFLWKGPFITLTREFVEGPTPPELVNENVIHTVTANIFRNYERFYAHQGVAIRNISTGSNTVVATGTGSGKTETFLVPIIDHCVRNPGKGIKAVLIYPMNALATDQKKRLQRLLKGTGVTFGMYVGSTPHDIEGEHTSRIAEEAISRNEIRDMEPNILITNYVMLEYLLTRTIDRNMFTSTPLKFIVLDEVHTYAGARGTDLAYLIRRFKRLTGNLCCIATSATVKSSDQADVQALKLFVEDLFGEPFSEKFLVEEQYKVTGTPSDISLQEYPLRIVADEILTRAGNGDQSAIVEIYKILTTDESEVNYEELNNLSNAYLSNTPYLRLLEYIFSVPRSIEDAIDIVQKLKGRENNSISEINNEIIAHLILGANTLGMQDISRIRPKLHVFFRGLWDISRCLNNSCGTILQSGQDLCPICSHKAFSMEVCRNCGQDFWIVEIFTENPDEEVAKSREGQLKSQSNRQYAFRLTDAQKFFAEQDDMDEEGMEGSEEEERLTWHSESDPQERLLCSNCGILYNTTNSEASTKCPSCETPTRIITTFKVNHKKCPACGGGTDKRDVVTSVTMGTASGIANLTTSTLANLDEEERKTLIFSDNRQDTAYQTGYIRDHHRAFTIRQLVSKLIISAKFGKPLDQIVQEIHSDAVNLKILDKPKNPYERDNQLNELFIMVLNEFTRRNERRVNLEGLGLISIIYFSLEELKTHPQIEKISTKYNLETKETVDICSVILDYFRFKRALNHQALQKPLGWNREHEWNTFFSRGFFYRNELKPHGFALNYDDTLPLSRDYTVKNLVYERARSNIQAYVRKFMSKEETNEFIKEVIELMLSEEFLVKTRIGSNSSNKQCIQAEYQKILLEKPEELYQCYSCLQVYRVNVRNQCATYNCKGELSPFSPDLDNFYVNFYLNRDPIPLLIAEHSGQIDDLLKQEIEEDFLKGNLNVIVCTPTLELGVDIGDLVTLIMRNVPPSPSNYAQRAGRAGRRNRVATIITYARNAPHDSYFYQYPTQMISGVIRPPYIQLNNPEILERHINSLILEEINSQFPNVMIDLTDMENEEKTALKQIKDEVVEKADQLAKVVFSTFQDSRVSWFTRAEAKNEVLEFPVSLTTTVMDWRKRLVDAYEEIDTMPRVLKERSEKRRREQLENLIRALEDPVFSSNSSVNTYPQSVLGELGLFPRYGFPGQVVYLERDGEFHLLSRSGQIALQEFAPGNFIYANSKIYRVNRISLGWVENINQQGPRSLQTRSRICPICGYFDIKGEDIVCNNCGNELESIDFVQARYFKASSVGSINAESEIRRNLGYKMSKHYSPVSLQKITAERQTWEWGMFTVTYQQRATIATINHGYVHGDEQFFVCPVCGYIPRSTDGTLQHSPGSTCTGEFENIKLGLVSSADALEIIVPEEYRDPSVIITLRTALILGAKIASDTEEDEIDGFEPSEALDRIILFETTTGSAGYLRRLLDKFNTIAQYAFDTLNICECQKSCYICLRQYRNQREHDVLDKRLVMDILNDLRAKSGDRAIDNNVDSTDVEDLCRKSESPIERILCEALLKTALPRAKQQWEIVNEEGIPITRADFAWPKQKIVVFCDGEEFHSPAVTKENYKRDLDIQNNLTILGWIVLRFTGSEIYKDVSSCVQKIGKLLSN